jgi:hypothetical protein
VRTSVDSFRCLPALSHSGRRTSEKRQLGEELSQLRAFTRDETDAHHLIEIGRIGLTNRLERDSSSSETLRHSDQLSLVGDGEDHGVGPGVQVSRARLAGSMNELRCEDSCGKITTDDHVVSQGVVEFRPDVNASWTWTYCKPRLGTVKRLVFAHPPPALGQLEVERQHAEKALLGLLVIAVSHRPPHRGLVQQVLVGGDVPG